MALASCIACMAAVSAANMVTSASSRSGRRLQAYHDAGHPDDHDWEAESDDDQSEE